ncbi:DUF2752 domain-containing protein [Streptomyces sp. ACA25]|uniref:DUF2752 domain-containing protein n=1 Tax=Streptomyces sp. ACA25 TaxID=3022596 RepID=UPI0023081104|nr:DUF2752 domain-containing protein [Streptomyces sp. ACA25]MDB1086534.1 DUF2752 domain-containing protein [Streptomyces sp. ACA25]
MSTSPRTAPGPVGRLRNRLSHPAVAPLTALAGGLAAAAYLRSTNPHEPGQLLPRCPFNWLTGLLCPACGGTRMAYDLLHGDVAAAFQDNAVLLLLGVPLAAWMVGRWLYEGLRGRRYRPVLSSRGNAVVLGVAVVWMLARNLTG